MEIAILICGKAGKNYFYCLHQAIPNSKKSLERIIKDVCRHDVLGDFRTGKS